ncbi:bifunctional nuclease family protein, partial [Candidatus Dependentiae bacterium]|nr:bifunctional nuclease family protein [Candidatus Dependentiae bacterium]
PIWIGIFEANSIMIALNKIKVPRPLTHDLAVNLINKLEGQLELIIISGLKEGIYFAELNIRVKNELIKIDARPSDSIAIAVRLDVPIFVNETLIELMVNLEEFKSKIVDEHLKTILDNLREDDFGKYKM